MQKKWYQKSFRRGLVDMHIPDWDASFLKNFDPQEYIYNMQKAGVDSVGLNANACTGLSFYPTKHGKMHGGLKGRDVFGELCEGFNKSGINVTAYMNCWSKYIYDEKPEWRTVTADGKVSGDYMFGQPGRYGVLCINSDYRENVFGVVRELCENYTFNGLWVDMLLWRTLCFCPSCRKKFLDETGLNLPEKIDWTDKVWLTYLKKREEWVYNFFNEIIDIVKSINKDITVMCNSSYFPYFLLAANVPFYGLGEYIGGDFESDRRVHSLNLKFFDGVSKNKPTEFLCSLTESQLNEHCILKSQDRLRSLLYATLANNARFGFIDAINIDGSLNGYVYDEVAKLFEEEKLYEPYLDSDAEFISDVAIYCNLESMMDLSDNGNAINTVHYGTKHSEATYWLAEMFMDNNILYSIITKNNIRNLSRYKVVIISNLLAISDEEAVCLEEYVKCGGRLYASADCGIFDHDGNPYSKGRLKELTGVSIIGRTKEAITYLKGENEYGELFLGYTQKHPMTMQLRQTLVKAEKDTKVLAKITLPYTDPADTTRYASAISDPPAVDTDYPAATLKKYGKGEVMYLAGQLETLSKGDQQRLFINFINYLCGEPTLKSDAPYSVEFTLYRQLNKDCLILNMVNIQRVLPNIPSFDISVSIKTDKKIKAIYSLPENKKVPFIYECGRVEFMVDRIDGFRMFKFEY